MNSSGALIIPTTLPAKYVKYSAAASSTTCVYVRHRNVRNLTRTHILIGRREEGNKDVEENHYSGDIPASIELVSPPRMERV